MEVLIILATGIMCLLSFYFGTKCSRNEEIISQETKEKILHPIETYKEEEERKEVEKENKIQRMQDATVLDNIDNYNGSSLGQKPIPFFEDEEDEDDEGDDF